MKSTRTNKNFSGEIKTKIGNGQTLITPVGADSSDKSGGARKEVPAKMKMGGGMNNLSDTLGKDA
tara:strand:+ start:134 stop:328 length:195 start_codon:yes stop_codon:yes gene_type:complete